MRTLITWIMATVFVWAQEPNFGTLNGSAVILDVSSAKRVVYGEHSNERLNPCSTFKILNSMIALETGVIKDEHAIIPWDNVEREYAVWNKDHTMRSAIAVSAVWFYQELARRIGAKRMQEYVRKVGYGNGDTSHFLTNFWLGKGSLKISLNEQVDFLKRVVEEDLPFSEKTIHTLKDIITLEKKQGYVFAGKTGSCNKVGWFVGFIKQNSETKIFAFNIKNKDATGAKAKQIAMEYFGIKD
ncbi:MAG: penicillin-binding transpeptidase domain-containing protein [Candidatus Marinarcus sp.]|uniref:penicillin-binding transpeptidase domain-containing protein n=1 Tax=Candidatus Marinarcus sp. TaxID=3100987 RepID=UPI003B004731